MYNERYDKLIYIQYSESYCFKKKSCNNLTMISKKLIITCSSILVTVFSCMLATVEYNIAFFESQTNVVKVPTFVVC